MKFVELGLADPLLRAVCEEGYTLATPIQAAAIPPVLDGRDVFGCAQTGTGKTAAFALPMLHRLAETPSRLNGRGRKIRCLVLAPTRELSQQIAESFATYGRHTPVRTTVIYGGVGQTPQVRALNRGVDVVVATPGRLLDLMQQGFVDLSRVEVLVLDEADRMLDMGFLPDMRRIVAKVPKQRQTLLFSATMPKEIRQLADEWLTDPVDVRVAPSASPVETIKQSVCFVAKGDKLRLLTEWLGSNAWNRVLVFTRTKYVADKVAKALNKAGIEADAFHGDKSQSVRQQAIARFKSPRPVVLVATDIASRGLDIDQVSHVMNFDLPLEAESYVHRIGRTGRAGADGTAISFCDGGERSQLAVIQRGIGRKLAVVPLPEGFEHQPAPVERQHQQGAPRNRFHGTAGAPPNASVNASARPPRRRKPLTRANHGKGRMAPHS